MGSHFMFGTGTRHQQVRENVVNEIMKREEEFLPFIIGEEENDITISQYCKRMIQPHSWGGNVELQALSHFYKRKIIIYSAKQPPIIIGDEYDEKILLWYSHGNHYDCVYPQAEMDIMTECQSIVLNLVYSLFDGDYASPNTKPKYKNFDKMYWQKDQQDLEQSDNRAAMNLWLDGSPEIRNEKEKHRLKFLRNNKRTKNASKESPFEDFDETDKQKKIDFHSKEAKKALRGVGKLFTKISPRSHGEL